MTKNNVLAALAVVLGFLMAIGVVPASPLIVGIAVILLGLAMII